MRPNVLQILPALEVGGVERGTLEIGRALVSRAYGSSVISAGGRLVEQLIQEGSNHYLLDIGRKTPLTFRHALAVKKIILANNINIIHVRSRMPAWVVMLALALIPRAKRPVLVSTVHGPYSVNFYSKVMMRADHIIAISEFIKSYILDNYPDTDAGNITLVHRGVDNSVFHPAYRPNPDWTAPWANKTDKGTKIITLPGRITRWKGQMDFIHIIHQLRQREIKVHGIIAGGAEKRRQEFLDELKNQIKNLGLENHISLIGQRSDMKDVMAASDIVLSLAKIPEAFGRTALEALCLGIPVVAYDHGGAHEVLANMYPQGLCLPNNIESVTDKIKELLDEPGTIAGNELFTLDSMINKTIGLYEKALQEKLPTSTG